MKKTRTMLALLVVLALLVSVTAVTVSADETVTSTLDCTTLAPSTDAATVQETLKNAGVVEASNVVIEDMHNPMICTLGYQGEGYFVQKIEAGEGKVFAAAPVLTLNYRLAAADPMGYIKVEGSIDGVTYYPFAELTEATGANYAPENRGTVNVTLTGGEGSSTVWVKISMQHWTSQDGAAVDSSVITASVKADPNAAPVVPENAVSSNLDVRTLTPAEPGEASNALLESLGFEVTGDWWVQDCHHVFATPKEGHDPCTLTQKLEAGEGKVFDGDVSLTAGYWLAAVSDPSWFWIEVSTDGENWTEFYADETGRGTEWQADAYAEGTLPVTGTDGASVVYIRYNIVRRSGQTSGGLTFSNITGNVKAAPANTPDEKPDTSNPKDGDTISIFVALAMVCAAGAVITTKKFRKEN